MRGSDFIRDQAQTYQAVAQQCEVHTVGEERGAKGRKVREITWSGPQSDFEDKFDLKDEERSVRIVSRAWPKVYESEAGIRVR